MRVALTQTLAQLLGAGQGLRQNIADAFQGFLLNFCDTSQSLNSSKLAPQLAEERGVFPMTFNSILFERTEDSIKKETLEAPVFFVDLNLDQIIDAITAGRQEYNLTQVATKGSGS